MQICCFCFGVRRSDSSISTKSPDEPYEYVVEKLVIKKVPLRHFATDEDLKDIHFCRKITDTPGRVENPIVTFSSYYQIGPPKLEYKSAKTILCPIKSEKNVGTEVVFWDNENPKDDLTSGRRQQLEQCSPETWANGNSKHETMAQVYNPPFIGKRRSPGTDDNLTKHDVLFTKPISTRGSSPVLVDPAVKKTLDILAVKKPPLIVNRRFVARDPETGQIKEIFQNIRTEKPINLNEIYQEDGGKLHSAAVTDGPDGDHKRSNSAGFKWKIIIKHHDDKTAKIQPEATCLTYKFTGKKKENFPLNTSTTYVTDSDE